MIAGSNRQKGKRRTGIVRIPGGGNISGGKGEGDVIISDVWITSRWDSRWEDWLRSGRKLISRRPSF